MPRKGENIRKRKDGRWEARYEKCRDQNGRIQYGYLYGRTYEAVKQKKLDILCQNNPRKFCGKRYVFRNLSEEWMLSMRYAVKLSTYACYETLLDTHILPEFGDTPLKYISFQILGYNPEGFARSFVITPCDGFSDRQKFF